MSQPNPSAERAEAFNQLREQYPDATDEQIEEMLDELASKHAYD